MSASGEGGPVVGRWFLIAALLAAIGGVTGAAWLFGRLAG